MADWVIYVVVGLVVGMNLGYMIGVRRGSVIVGELLTGIMSGFGKITEAVGDVKTADGRRES